MSDIIYVTELILGGKTVYKQESCQEKNETIEFKQYKADALTGKEIKELSHS